MDTYQPSTAEQHLANRDEKFKAQLRELDAAAALIRAEEHAYAEGRSDEREQWVPLAGELRARILNKHQFGGTVLLSLEDVLAISAALARAE